MVEWRTHSLATRLLKRNDAQLSMSKDYLNAAIEIAQEAGKILREEFDRPVQIAYKGDVDLVTQADKRSEQAIVARLTKYFPEHSISSGRGKRARRRVGISLACRSAGWHDQFRAWVSLLCGFDCAGATRSASGGSGLQPVL